MLRLSALLVKQGIQAERSQPAARLLARCFSGFTPALKAEDTTTASLSTTDAEFRPPVPTYGIAGRYAAALYTAAAKQNKLDEVNSNLSSVVSLAEENDVFEQYLKDPSIPRKQKMESLNALFVGMQLGDLTKSFVDVLAENGRLSQFGKVVTTFQELVAASRGEVTAHITSAEQLEQEDLEDILASLTELCEEDEQLLYTETVDPKIIGGVIVEIGDKYIDMSILSQVKKIQQIVREAV